MHYYEAHITFLGNPETVKKVIAGFPKWHFSRIEDDIKLGKGVKSYATRHYKGKLYAEVVIAQVKECVKQYREQLLIANDAYVLRSKVELIIYDSAEI